MFNHRTYFLNLQRIDILHKDHRMGVAHGDKGDLNLFAVDHHRVVDHLRQRSLKMSGVSSGEDGASHIDADAFYQVRYRIHRQAELFDARPGAQCNLSPVGESPLIEILPHAPRGITAHLPFTSVGVEHAHGEITLTGGSYQDQSITPHTKMAVAQPAGELSRVLHIFLKQVDIDIIIACGLHFFELHIDILFYPIAPSSVHKKTPA